VLSTYAGNADTNTESPVDGAESVAKEDAHLFAPSSVCVDPTNPSSVLISTDDVQKVIRRLDQDGTQSCFVMYAIVSVGWHVFFLCSWPF
jgi:histidinol-phosphate/aromatic aminotransferase/cobyric acid decarboxylase-like protein